MCFTHEEIISYNEKSVHFIILQFGSVNSRNLLPLTVILTRVIGLKASSCLLKRGGKIEAPPESRRAFEVTEAWTFGLVNFVFSQSSNWYSDLERPFQIDKPMVITDRWAHCLKSSAIKLWFETVSKKHMLTLSLLLDWCRVLLEFAKIEPVKQSGLLVPGCEYTTRLYIMMWN